MKKILLTLFVTIAIAVPVFVSAQSQGDNEKFSSDSMVNGGAPDSMIEGGRPAATNTGIPTLGNPLKAKNLTDLLYTVVDLLIFLGVIVAVFMFIFIGFKFVAAQGSGEKIKEAQKWFMYAVIGTAILISSKVIVEVIKKTLTSAGVVDERIWNNKP